MPRQYDRPSTDEDWRVDDSPPGSGVTSVTVRPAEQQEPAVEESPSDQLAVLYRFFADHLDELRAMPSSFSSVRRGLPLVVDADDLVSIVLGRMADLLLSASSTDERLARVTKYCTLGYVYRAMEHEAIDRGRVAARQQPWNDAYAADRPSDESGPEHAVLRTGVTQQLVVILSTLRRRSTRDRPPTTCITEIHVRCIQAIQAGHGSQTTLAMNLGVDDSRVTQIKKQVFAKIKETIYVAGVLGHRDGLSRSESIDSALDVYDGTKIRVHSAADRARLSAAAGSVTITRDRGQRADAAAAAVLYLRRPDKKVLRGQLSAAGGAAMTSFVADFVRDLHRSEAAQSEAAGVAHPNCCTACPAHNPSIDRVVWEVEAR